MNTKAPDVPAYIKALQAREELLLRRRKAIDAELQGLKAAITALNNPILARTLRPVQAKAVPSPRPSRKGKWKGFLTVPSLTSTILRTAFGSNGAEPPQTLQELFEGRYRAEWKEKKVVGTHGKQMSDVLTMPQDLDRGDQSLLRKTVGEGAERLWRVHHGVVSEDKVAPMLANLARDIPKERWPMILSTLEAWGVHISFPNNGA